MPGVGTRSRIAVEVDGERLRVAAGTRVRIRPTAHTSSAAGVDPEELAGAAGDVLDRGQGRSPAVPVLDEGVIGRVGAGVPTHGPDVAAPTAATSNAPIDAVPAGTSMGTAAHEVPFQCIDCAPSDR